MTTVPASSSPPSSPPLALVAAGRAAGTRSPDAGDVLAKRILAFTGGGALESKKAALALDADRNYEGYFPDQTPEGAYTIEPRVYRAGRTQISEMSSVEALCEAGARLGAQLGPVAAGGMEARGNNRRATDSQGTIEVILDNSMVLFEISGGSDGFCCFYPRSNVHIYVLSTPRSLASPVTQGSNSPTDAIQQEFSCQQQIQMSLTQAALETSNVFTPRSWASFYGEVPDSTLNPREVLAFLDGPCPIYPGKKMRDTHIVAFLPNAANGTDLTLGHMQTLLKNPRQGQSVDLKLHRSVKKVCLDNKIPQSCWAAMTSTVLPNTKGVPYEEMQQRVSLPQGYTFPSLPIAAFIIASHYTQTGKVAYAGIPNPPSYTFTYCTETILNENNQLKPAMLGGFENERLWACIPGDNNRQNIGVAAMRILQRDPAVVSTNSPQTSPVAGGGARATAEQSP